MTIAQALKEKNKKVAKIEKLWSRISSYNSVEEGSEKPYNLDSTWREYLQEIDDLVKLKTAIHAASAPVREQIFRLSEIKSAIRSIKGLSVNNGKLRNRYMEEPIELKAHFGVEWKDSTVEAYEAEIEKMQEKLDQFNHSTQI
jgi:DNA repair ATPase RecN